MRLSRELPPVFRGRDAVHAGSLSAAQLRGPLVRRLFVGIYCPAGAIVDHVLRCRAAALLGEGQLVLTGRSAATVRGVDLARPDDPVEVVVLDGHRVNRRAGLDVRSVRIDPPDHAPWHEIRIASPVRTAFDVASRGPTPRAVAGLDHLLHAEMISVRDLASFLHGRSDDGVVHARAALSLADGRAESPPESVLRVVLAQAGMIFVPQLVVRHHGRFVARVDLGDDGLRLAVEYDGRWHAERGAFTRDRERLNRLQGAGWTVLTITAETLGRPRDVVALVAAAVQRGRRDVQLRRSG